MYISPAWLRDKREVWRQHNLTLLRAVQERFLNATFTNDISVAGLRDEGVRRGQLRGNALQYKDISIIDNLSR